MTSTTTRDRTIDILKGIGICLMVIGHAGCPKLLHNFIYSFHMPLFFIASGLFFKDEYLNSPWSFVKKKLKGIYVPFLRSSIFFLLLHNIFYRIGLINDEFGTIDGTVSHLYSFYDVLRHGGGILLKMSSYETFILGAYWFLRALFWGSIMLCLFSSALKALTSIATKYAILIIAVGSYLIAGCIKYYGLNNFYFSNGGYREFMAVFFIALGYFLNKISFSSINYFIGSSIFICLLLYIHPASLEGFSTYVDWMFIPISGVCGYILVRYLSNIIGQSNWNPVFARVLSFVGKNSFWIVTLHLLFFKVSELLEIGIYELPIQMIGCHTIIPPLDNYFWLLHSVLSICLCLVVAYCIHKYLHIKF